jgi:hypothetical protein
VQSFELVVFSTYWIVYGVDGKQGTVIGANTDNTHNTLQTCESGVDSVARDEHNMSSDRKRYCIPTKARTARHVRHDPVTVI